MNADVRGRPAKGLKGSLARVELTETGAFLSDAGRAGGIPASLAPDPREGSGATMIRAHFGQGPSNPAAAGGTRRVVPQAGH